MTWTLARRAERLNPSVVREILKLTSRPDIISLAGGLPSADTFPVQAMREASARVLAEAPTQALQYAASEGFGPLRAWVATQLTAQGLTVDAAQVLITTGSQQGLDLAAKVLVDPGSVVAVESPTYLGALQAFAPYEPELLPVAGDDEGPTVEGLAKAKGARFLYMLPSFQNPTGRCLGAKRREALMAECLRLGLPVLEDNPYGDLWYDEPPPPPLAALAPDGVLYLGSFSKVLAPGLRLGYLVAPTKLFPKLLQAKQAADLHTPGLNQRVVFEVIKDGFLDRHVPTIRARYRTHRDAMATALERYLPAGSRWQLPQGGMFFWVELPAGLDALELLPAAVEAGVSYVPGTAFYSAEGRRDTMRLSFVTAPPEQIDAAVAKLGALLQQAAARAV